MRVAEPLVTRLRSIKCPLRATQGIVNAYGIQGKHEVQKAVKKRVI